MNRTSLLINICLVAIVAASCSASSKKLDLGGQCIQNSDCNNPLACKFQACHQQCVQSRDCPTGQQCVAADDGSGVCQTQAEAACGANGNTCGSPLVCVSNICVNVCPTGACPLATQTCIGGAVCVDNTALASDAGAGCISDCASPPWAADAAPSGTDVGTGGVDAAANAADAPVSGVDAPASGADVAASGAEVPANRADVAVNGADAAANRGDVIVSGADAATSGADAITGGADAGGIDAATSLPFQPSNLAPTDTTGLYVGGLVYDGTHCGATSTNQSIDTDKGTAGCSFKAGVDYTYIKATQTDGSQVGVFLTKQMQIARTFNVSVNGSLPLVIVVSDSILILGTLSATPGQAGGYPGVTNGAGKGPGAGLCAGGGGGGGSFCGNGGKGVNGTQTNGTGRVYATPTLMPLIGGSSGGASGYLGASGAGGGAIELVAGNAFQLDALGQISADGGGGVNLGDQLDSGGGSGGAILIEAPTAVVAGTITSNGGGGSTVHGS